MATPAHLQKAPPTYDDFTISDDEPAPIKVISRKITPRPNPAERILVDRKVIDETTPRAKAALALLCWANSVATSMVSGIQVQLLVHRHFHPADPSLGFPLAGALGGFAFQALLTFGQIYTAERSRTGYLICLFPDAAMTAIQWAQWLFYPILIASLSLVLPAKTALLLALAVAALAAWVVGVWSAKLPERMIFGQRRSI